MGKRKGYIAPGRRKQKMSKKKAARIANAGKTHAGRSRMAKKAARTRKRRGH
jgi:hypothetical protein